MVGWFGVRVNGAGVCVGWGVLRVNGAGGSCLARRQAVFTQQCTYTDAGGSEGKGQLPHGCSAVSHRG